MGNCVLPGIAIVLASQLVGCGAGDASSSCSPWCTVVEECTETSFSDCMEACAKELSAAGAVSSGCEDAVKSQNTCLGELACAEFQSWRTETPPDAYPCKSADDAVMAACAP